MNHSNIFEEIGMNREYEENKLSHYVSKNQTHMTVSGILFFTS